MEWQTPRASKVKMNKFISRTLCRNISVNFFSGKNDFAKLKIEFEIMSILIDIKIY